MVDIWEGSSRVLVHREEVARELDSRELDIMELDSRELDNRELASRELDSKELDSRGRGLGTRPDLHCGATSRIGAPEGKAVGSSILIRVFSREARVKPISKHKQKWGRDNLSPNLTNKKLVKL